MGIWNGDLGLGIEIGDLDWGFGLVLGIRKIKMKLVSESIKDKIKCYDKINVKNESSGKVVKIEKLSKLKDNLNENVKLQPSNGDTEVERNDGKEVRNAFALLLESSKGGCSTPKTPKRKYTRRKIGLITPTNSQKKNGIVEWLRSIEKEKRNLKK